MLAFEQDTIAAHTATEKSVMDTIERLGRYDSILPLAHRRTIVGRFHNVVEIKQARAVSRGFCEELLQSSPNFAHMFEVPGWQ